MALVNGHVTWKATRLFPDSDDAGTAADALPAIAFVTFIRPQGFIIDYSTPETVFVKPQTFAVDGTGVLRDGQGNIGVDLPIGWWRAVFNIPGYPPPRDVIFEVTAGQTTDLSRVTPVTDSTAIPASYTDEQAQDAIAQAIAAGTHSGIAVAYDDVAGSFSFTNTAGGSGGSSPNATTTSPGLVQLAGDLGGTATSPSVPGLASKVGTGDARLTDTRTPTDASVTNAKVATNAAISADKLADGTTNKLLTATERTKLTGIATGATANATDAQLRDRATHTGTQAASTITGLAAVATSGLYSDLTGAPSGSGASGSEISPTGGDPTGAADSTTALQNVFTAAISQGKEVYIPPGTWKCSSGLVWNGDPARIRGAGAGATILQFTGNTYDYLSVGSGAGNQVRPTGWLRDMTIYGPTSSPVTGKAAVKINGMTQFVVSNVQVLNQDIGFDLVNNCFGAQFNNVRAGFGGTCNVGANLRTGVQSGSDITFINPWLSGQVAGAHMSGGGGGYHFVGGQINAGQGTFADNDVAGGIVVGKDYLTGATGETTLDLYGVSFEGTGFAHCIRSFDRVRINAQGVYFSPQEPTTPAITALKMTNAQNSSVLFAQHIIAGYWSAVQMVQVSGAWDDCYIREDNAYQAAAQPTVNGVSTFVVSLLEQSAPGGIPAKWMSTRGDRITTAAGVIAAAPDTSLLAPKANTVAFVNHGSVASTARPTGYGMVIWYGSVDPTNRTAVDIWNGPSA